MHSKSSVATTLCRIGGALGAAYLFLLPVGAGAQPAEHVLPSPKRYKIEAMRFKAVDETGVDWPGSDEVMVETRDARGWTVSNEIGDIDSGDTHHFDPAKSCVVAVRPGTVVLGETSVCDNDGEPGPLWFKVSLWEKDWVGYPTGFCGVLPAPPGHHRGPHCADDGNGDDFIGRARLVFPESELDAALPNVGDEVIETVRLHPCSGNCAGFHDYRFTYRVTRMPDADPQNELTRELGKTSDASAAQIGSATANHFFIATETAGAEATKETSHSGMGDMK